MKDFKINIKLDDPENKYYHIYQRDRYLGILPGVWILKYKLENRREASAVTESSVSYVPIYYNNRTITLFEAQNLIIDSKQAKLEDDNSKVLKPK